MVFMENEELIRSLNLQIYVSSVVLKSTNTYQVYNLIINHMRVLHRLWIKTRTDKDNRFPHTNFQCALWIKLMTQQLFLWAKKEYQFDVKNNYKTKPQLNTQKQCDNK